MLNFQKRAIGLIAMLAVLGLAPGAVAKTTTYEYSSKAIMAPLLTGNGYPGVGGTALLAGSLKSKPLGAGAVIDRVSITGNPEPTVLSLKGKEVDFFAGGTLRNTFTGTATIQVDGSQKVVAIGRLTGGTERYRGATGRFKFTGTIPAGSTVLSGRGRGTLTY